LRRLTLQANWMVSGRSPGLQRLYGAAWAAIHPKLTSVGRQTSSKLSGISWRRATIPCSRTRTNWSGFC